MNELIFALALLSAPELEPIPPFTVVCYQEILRHQCLQDEILDPAETANYLRLRATTVSQYDPKTETWKSEPGLNWEEMRNDLVAVRERYTELQGFPYSCDCRLFPEQEYANAMWSLSYDYGNYLNNLNNSGYRADSWRIRQAIVETDQLTSIWMDVRLLNGRYSTVAHKRKCLKRLKDTIGDENYYNGYLPCPVPLWRAETIK